jgi:hypothetical protein
MAGFCATGVEALRFTARKLVTQSFYANSARRIVISLLENNLKYEERRPTK